MSKKSYLVGFLEGFNLTMRIRQIESEVVFSPNVIFVEGCLGGFSLMIVIVIISSPKENLSEKKGERKMIMKKKNNNEKEK